jgi:hypothetical protein
VCPVERPVEEGVLTVEDGLLQGAFADGMPRPGLCRVGSPVGASRADWADVVCA